MHFEIVTQNLMHERESVVDISTKRTFRTEENLLTVGNLVATRPS